MYLGWSVTSNTINIQLEGSSFDGKKNRPKKETSPACWVVPKKDGPGQGGAALGGTKGVQGKTFGELRRRGREG